MCSNPGNKLGKLAYLLQMHEGDMEASLIDYFSDVFQISQKEIKLLNKNHNGVG